MKEQCIELLFRCVVLVSRQSSLSGENWWSFRDDVVVYSRLEETGELGYYLPDLRLEPPTALMLCGTTLTLTTSALCATPSE